MEFSRIGGAHESTFWGAVWDQVRIRLLSSACHGCKCLYYLMPLDCHTLCPRDFQEISEMSCRTEFLRNINSLPRALGAPARLQRELKESLIMNIFFFKSVLVGHWGILTRLYSHDGPPRLSVWRAPEIPPTSHLSPVPQQNPCSLAS